MPRRMRICNIDTNMHSDYTNINWGLSHSSPVGRGKDAAPYGMEQTLR